MKKKSIKDFLKKRLMRYVWMLVAIIILVVMSGYLFVKSQIMNQLDYNITLNEDGSATVIETWDVYITKTNTLFRNFQKSESFKNIENVSVVDLTTGKQLKQIYEEMYHVTTDCFYALDIVSNKFEIAWGTGMENKSGRKKYQIKYTINNVISGNDTISNDYQEFYWKLLDSSNAIPVKIVTGTIKMPESVKDIDNLKVWGHGPLNGKIEVKSNNTVYFEVKNLGPGRMLEVRILTLENMFNNYNYKYQTLNQILDEEDLWANEANNKSGVFYGLMTLIYIVAIIINIIQSIKLYRITKRKDDGLIHRDLKYFRDIPREGSSTPPEAAYLYFFDKNNTQLTTKQSSLVSAVILNLTLKGYIKLRTEEKDIFVTILKGKEGLNNDEKAVYEILKNTNKKENEEFNIAEIKTFAKKDYYKYSQLISSMINESRESIYRLQLVDRAERKAYKKSLNSFGIYAFIIGTLEFLAIAFLMGFLPIINRAYINIFGVGYRDSFITTLAVLAPLIVTVLIKLKIRSKTTPKIAVITQKGLEEQEEWKGLANYMQDFSAFEKKGVPELVLWEKYLVFATAFGLADKVIQQMKAKYPEVFVEEYWSDEQKDMYQVLSFATNNIVFYSDAPYSPIESLSNSAKNAYSTSLAEIARHSSSGGSGGGGGFSGGGRWTAEAEAGMGGR